MTGGTDWASPKRATGYPRRSQRPEPVLVTVSSMWLSGRATGVAVVLVLPAPHCLFREGPLSLSPPPEVEEFAPLLPPEPLLPAEVVPPDFPPVAVPVEVPPFFDPPVDPPVAEPPVDPAVEPLVEPVELPDEPPRGFVVVSPVGVAAGVSTG